MDKQTCECTNKQTVLYPSYIAVDLMKSPLFRSLVSFECQTRKYVVTGNELTSSLLSDGCL
jgi:hypothetical protein